MTKKPYIASIIAIVCVALIAIFIYDFVLKSQAPKPQTQKQTKPIVVETTKVTREKWQEQIQATGTLEAYQGVLIRSSLNQVGIVMNIAFEPGQWVEEGQTLFYINPADSTVIPAPFSGRIGLNEVEVGDFISPGDTLVSLQRTDQMKVAFSIPQSHYSDVSLGDTVLINVNAYPNKTFTGTVYAIDSQLDLDTRTLRIWAKVPNQDEELFPGSFTNVTLITQKTDDVLTVPQTAILYDESGEYVFKVNKEGFTEKEIVTIGKRKNADIAILKGLQEGDEIVSAGKNKVSNGSLVSIKQENTLDKQTPEGEMILSSP